MLDRNKVSVGSIDQASESCKVCKVGESLLGLNTNVGDLHVVDDHSEALRADSSHSGLGQVYSKEGEVFSRTLSIAIQEGEGIHPIRAGHVTLPCERPVAVTNSPLPSAAMINLSLTFVRLPQASITLVIPIDVTRQTKEGVCQ